MSAPIREQLRRNAVALISLVVAVTSLGYNTWRNEHSETNRNERLASFEVLIKLGELEEITYRRYYDAERSGDVSLRTGWAKVLTIRDLSAVVDMPVQDTAQALHRVWDENWADLDKGVPESVARIRDAINAHRQSTIARLKELD